ncbi:GHMP kinase [Embleya sp. NPDC008237]|uniref:GHMP family kinase ATP-binding protein n=1 Tax=Embleya sp. NPDC008237 TaxID=3363978 RepID=UPI0036E4E921
MASAVDPDAFDRCRAGRLTVVGAAARPGPARGSAMAHHGEILQGVFERDDGGLAHAVVSLPLPALHAHATFVPARTFAVTVSPAWKTKAAGAARETLRWLGVREGGRLSVHSSIPVERGMGSSTADVVGAIRAVARAHGRAPTEADVAALAVRAEGASDGVMFGPRAVLYANREGYVLEDLGGPLPALHVLGFDVGGPDVDTIAQPPREYRPSEIEHLRHLRVMVRRAVAEADCALLARTATASARLNQRFLPQAALPLAERICRAGDGLGVQVAHSGRVVAVLFDPAADGLGARLADARRRLRAAGVERVWSFRTDSVAAGEPVGPRDADNREERW